MPTARASARERSRVRRATRPRTRAHASRPRRTWLASLAAVAAILLAVITWQALQYLFSDRTPAPVSSTTAPSAAAVAGVASQVTIGDAGGLHVVETLTFETAQTRIDLAVPRRGGAGEDFQPSISSLMVRGPEPVREAGSMGVGDQTSIRFDSPARRVVLEYDAGGVVQHSGDASSPERALALVTPLVVIGTGGLPATVEVQSVKVLNVGCLHRGVLTGCGTHTREGWTVETSGGEGSPDVFAQLNLAVP